MQHIKFYRIIFVSCFLTIVVIFTAQIAFSRQVTLVWEQVTDPKVKGYKIYSGRYGTNYRLVPTIVIDNPKKNYCTIQGIEEGNIYVFSATSFDSNGLESLFSKELYYSVGNGYTVKEGSDVDIDSSQFVSKEDIYSIYWSQMSGPKVDLSNPSEAALRFTAPYVDSDTVLNFELEYEIWQYWSRRKIKKDISVCVFDSGYIQPKFFIRTYNYVHYIDSNSGTKDYEICVSFGLDPGDHMDQLADWWIAAYVNTIDWSGWFSYVPPDVWKEGIHLYKQLPIRFLPSLEVLRAQLPKGDYTFIFAVDNNADEKPDVTWWDYVEVKVK